MTHTPPLGKLWGISLGPGDPELITVKALRLLQNNTIIAFPAGRDGRPGIAQQILMPWLKAEQHPLPLWFPYVSDPAVLASAWQAAADQVWQYLATGQNVVFATEGDASFYSTFTYLAQTLQAQHPEALVETVPGVCSPLAAAAVLGQPLTILNQRLTILPAMHTLKDLTAALEQSDVVVLMKVASVYRSVWQVLKAQGLLPHSQVIVRATCADQVLYRDLTPHPVLELPYFSLLIVYCGSALP
jgi:precorrin-2/cobalt-factor-2 C20-methyltransferase